MLEEGIPANRIHFVLLEGSPELIAKRLAARHHEFMNSSLLESQFAILEPPTEANALRVMNDRPPDEVVEEILSRITHAGLEVTVKSKEKLKERGKRSRWGHPLFDLKGKSAVGSGGNVPALGWRWRSDWLKRGRM